MLIQYLLIGGVGLLLVFFLKHHGTSRTAAWVKIAFVVFGICGVLAVLFPNAVSEFAHLLGVGRGTDLLIYALATGFAFYSINTYLRFKEIEGRYAELARAIALQNSRHPAPVAADDAEQRAEESWS